MFLRSKFEKNPSGARIINFINNFSHNFFPICKCIVAHIRSFLFFLMVLGKKKEKKNSGTLSNRLEAVCEA